MDKLGLVICAIVFVSVGLFLSSTIRHTGADTFEVMDLTKHDNALRGFYGTIFLDGFVYFTPDHNGAPFGKFVRYDTSKPFDTYVSWEVFDSSIISKHAGYLGGGTDGKFLYFPSYNTGIILRYDTMKNFQDGASWEEYYTGMKFWGETSYDGRHVYFLPEHHTMLTRFDTNGDFLNNESWESCDLRIISDSADFMASSFDGKFLYLPSSTGKFILKYDSQKPFCDIKSWQKFDVNNIANRDGYFDAKFDGHYVYFSPNRNDGTAHGMVLRYDTTKSFTDSTSWESFNPSLHYGLKGAKGYGMMTLDHNRLYFSPLVNWKGYHSNILSYDIGSDFDQIDSWSVINIASYDNDLRGYPTSASDGKFVYFSPYHNNNEKHGQILRIAQTPAN